MTGELDRALGRLAVIADEVDVRSGTPRHSARVTTLARRLLREFQVEGDEFATIVMAARVHDIGKQHMPEELLRKPGPLSEHEWEQIQLHPYFGAQALSLVPAWAGLAPIVFAHHERFDGGGYPQRVSGTRIPFGARVLAVADSLDAMISPRPYRSPYSLDQAVATLVAGANRQWDADIVAICVAMLREEEVAVSIRIS
jgi:HD-GYP domain-containing protein (c-di-GMP phosphodiesterase class II)